MPRDYVPSSDSNYVTWYDNFYTTLQSMGATVGVVAADLTVIDTSGSAFQVALGESAAADAAAQQKTEAKDAARALSESDVRKLVRRIKLHSAYTPAIGEQLGIIAPQDTTDLATVKPKLKGTAQPHGVVEIGWTKGKTDGVNLYSQRDGESGFTFLARDTSSPYVDNRTLLVAGKPETRRYKAICVVDDAEVGQPSDEVVVAAQP